jgi:hypothetical protein
MNSSILYRIVMRFRLTTTPNDLADDNIAPTDSTRRWWPRWQLKLLRFMLVKIVVRRFVMPVATRVAISVVIWVVFLGSFSPGLSSELSFGLSLTWHKGCHLRFPFFYLICIDIKTKYMHTSLLFHDNFVYFLYHSKAWNYLHLGFVFFYKAMLEFRASFRIFDVPREFLWRPNTVNGFGYLDEFVYRVGTQPGTSTIRKFDIKSKIA